MKKILMSVLLAGTFLTAQAADNWLTDLPKAKEIAQKENKAILIDFTGSDWCPPCMKLKKDVLSTSEFEEFAKKNLVLVEIDFPNKKEQSDELKAANEKLKNQYKIEGFPTILVLDAKGNKLGEEVGYGGENPKEYIKKIEGMLAKKSS